MAVAVLVLAGCIVGGAAAAAPRWVVLVAAILAVAAGCLSARAMYNEVLAERNQHARDRAALARDFGAALAAKQAVYDGFAATMAGRLQASNREVTALGGTIRLLDKRVDEAVTSAALDKRRADDAQARLTELLDEVLHRPQPAAALAPDSDEDDDPGDLPTIVDLLGWEQHANATTVSKLRAADDRLQA